MWFLFIPLNVEAWSLLWFGFEVSPERLVLEAWFLMTYTWSFGGWCCPCASSCCAGFTVSPLLTFASSEGGICPLLLVMPVPEAMQTARAVSLDFPGLRDK